MFRLRSFGAVLGLGLLAEALAFAAVADRFGFGFAVLLTFAFSLFGAVMLRRSGFSMLAAFRSFAGRGAAPEGALADGVLGALGALLLILPGFLTDLIGLFLLLPSGRQWVVRRIGFAAGPAAGPGRPAAGTIDLGAGDWTRLDKM